MKWQDSGVSLSLQNGWQLLTLGWQMVINDNGRFHGNLGPFYLVLIPLLAFGRRPRREVWLILGFSVVYGLLWLIHRPARALSAAASSCVGAGIGVGPDGLDGVVQESRTAMDRMRQRFVALLDGQSYLTIFRRP